MQNAVDAAVCAGCLKLSVPIPTGQAQAKTEANSILTSNNFSSANATMTFTEDTVKNPANAPEINCNLTNALPTYFMQVLGIKTVNLSAYAEAILESKVEDNPGGPFNYTLFSNTNLSLNGAMTIQGAVHSNGLLTLNGSQNITQAAEGYGGVSVNGAYDLGSIKAGPGTTISENGAGNNPPESYTAADISMPNYTSQILSTPGLISYSLSETFNGVSNLTNGIAVNGSVTLNGAITDTGAILATGTSSNPASITVNGAASISGSNQVFLYSEYGNITINGADNFGTGTSSVVLYAPNGTISINGASTINGHVIGNSLSINGGSDVDGLDQGNDYPIIAINFGYHAKLID